MKSRHKIGGSYLWRLLVDGWVLSTLCKPEASPANVAAYLGSKSQMSPNIPHCFNYLAAFSPES